jgi:predicted phage tail protein
MVGKASRLNPLELRKQLLIAESEINRARLSEDWRKMRRGARNLAHRARIFAMLASSAALLAAGVTALRRGPPAPGTAKSSWFQRILNGTRLASTIWFAFRSRGAKDEHQ